MHKFFDSLKRVGTLAANIVCGFIPGKRARGIVRDALDPFSPPHVKAYFRRRYIPLLKKARFGDEAAAKGRYVFQCWWQGYDAAPPLVKNCIDSVAGFARGGGYSHVLITEDNVESWARMPERIWARYREGKISKTHLSDVLRTYLLAEHGGYWIDATYLMTAPFPPELEARGAAFFLSTGAQSWSLVDNSFIYAARRRSYIMERMKFLVAEYWAREERAVQYCLWHLMFRALVESDARAGAEFARAKRIDQEPHYRLLSHLSAPFDAKRFSRIVGAAFIHKLTRHADAMPAGSFAAELSER